MSWYERINRWISGAGGTPGGGDDPDELERMLAKLETSVSRLRGQLAAMMAARREAETTLERLVAEEARWEASARSALAKGNQADAKRCVARQLAAAEETKDFAAEVERRRRELDRAREALDRLEDLLGQTRMRRDTALAKQRLRRADADWSDGLDAAHAAQRDGREFIRGWDRFERAAENAMSLLGGTGSRKDAEAGGLAPDEEPPRPAPVPGWGATDAKERGDARPEDLDKQLARLRDELQGKRRAPSSREAELDRLLDELDQ